MIIKLGSAQNNREEVVPSVVTYGYDMHDRSWCVIVEDQEGNEIESSYVGTKEGCKLEIERYKEKYGISEVKKYKAY